MFNRLRKVFRRFRGWIGTNVLIRPKANLIIKIVNTILLIGIGVFILFFEDELKKGSPDIWALLVVMYLVHIVLIYVPELTTIKGITLSSYHQFSQVFRMIADKKPTVDWQNWDLPKWDKEFDQLSNLISQAINSIVYPSNPRIPTDRFNKKLNKAVSCNLMIFYEKDECTEKEILDIGETIFSGVNPEKDHLQMYNPYSDSEKISDKNLKGYLVLSGFGEQVKRKTYSGLYLKVPSSDKHALPGAPQAIISGSMVKFNHETFEFDYVPFVDNQAEFEGRVSETLKGSFIDYFKNENINIKSFLSICLFWKSEPIGVVTLESDEEDFLFDKNIRDIVTYAISPCLPVLGTYAYILKSIVTETIKKENEVIEKAVEAINSKKVNDEESKN